ncbi:MAG: hypothetical protein ABF908_04575 [Lentilactobacillus diolivorans]
MIKFKMIFTYCLASAIALVSTLTLTTTASAQTRFLSNVANQDFLMTNRIIHTTNSYFNDVNITIPKGTVFQVSGLSKGAKTGYPYVSIDTNQLRWSLRKPFITSKHDQQLTAGIWATTKNFKKVTAPNYLRYYSPNQMAWSINYGFIWQGFKYPASNQIVKAKENAVRVTTDGYLEFLKDQPAIGSSKISQPFSTAKVQKSTTKGNITYLYTTTKIAGLPSTHINASGRYQYRLKVINTNHHLVTINPRNNNSNSKYVDSAVIVSRCYIGNTKTNYYKLNQFAF